MYQVENGPVFYCAAIRYYEPEHGGMIELYGKRHCDILTHIAALGHTRAYKRWNEQGFLVSEKANQHDVFLNREDATKLARKYNIPMAGSVLTSEDLW